MSRLAATVFLFLLSITSLHAQAQVPSPSALDARFMGVVQQLLTNVGHNVEPIDGKWGAATERAIKAFAAAHEKPSVVSNAAELLYELMVAYGLNRTGIFGDWIH